MTGMFSIDDDDIELSEDDDLLNMFLTEKENEDKNKNTLSTLNSTVNSSVSQFSCNTSKLPLAVSSHNVAAKQTQQQTQKLVNIDKTQNADAAICYLTEVENQKKKLNKFKFRSPSMPSNQQLSLTKTTNHKDQSSAHQRKPNSIFENFLIDDDEELLSQIDMDSDNIFEFKKNDVNTCKSSSKSPIGNCVSKSSDQSQLQRHSSVTSNSFSLKSRISSDYQSSLAQKTDGPILNEKTSTWNAGSASSNFQFNVSENTHDFVRSPSMKALNAKQIVHAEKNKISASASLCGDNSRLSVCSSHGKNKTSALGNYRISTTPKRFAVQNFRNSISPAAGSSREPAPKRKFPGPAGALPKLKNSEQLDMLKSPVISEEKRSLTPLTPKTPVEPALNFSQEDDLHFSSVWQDLISYVEKNYTRATVDKLSLILDNASGGKLVNGKVTLVCAMIKSFVINGSAGRVLLKDTSGQMSGAVHQNVLEEYEPYLKPGTGMILKDVSIFSPSSKKHYLNITPSNIIQLFPGELNESLTQATQEIQSQTLSQSSKFPENGASNADNLPGRFKPNEKEGKVDNAIDGINDFFSDEINIDW